MYCTNCGNEQPQGAKVCANCQQPAPYFPPPPHVPNYLVQSIVLTLCCCLPFGVVALVYSAQVNSKLAAGDVAGAEASSRSAKTWCIVALVAGIVSGAGMAALSLWQ
jgi:hypothetical protein